jgi:hypothetical protein
MMFLFFAVAVGERPGSGNWISSFMGSPVPSSIRLQSGGSAKQNIINNKEGKPKVMQSEKRKAKANIESEAQRDNRKIWPEQAALVSMHVEKIIR